MIPDRRGLTALSPNDFAALLARAEPEHVWPLWRARLRHNLPESPRFCWPERFNLPFNELHESLFALGELPRWDERPPGNILDAIAAPRGFGKPAVCSFVQLAHAAVYDLEAYILLISAGQRLARSLSRDLRSQFKPARHRRSDPRPLSRLFGVGARGAGDGSPRHRPSGAGARRWPPAVLAWWARGISQTGVVLTVRLHPDDRAPLQGMERE